MCVPTQVWIYTVYGWWVRAASTCVPPVATTNAAVGTYTVEICDAAAAAGADPALLAVYLQARPQAVATWELSNRTRANATHAWVDDGGEAAANGTSHAVYRPAPVVPHLSLRMASRSYDYDGGTVVRQAWALGVVTATAHAEVVDANLSAAALRIAPVDRERHLAAGHLRARRRLAEDERRRRR